MTQRFHRRLRIKGFLMAKTPLHVGGKGGNSESDQPLARNGKDEFYLPGTSLAGPMRSWMEKKYGHDSKLMRQLWGWQPTGGLLKSETGTASRLMVEDAPVMLEGEAFAEILDGIAIDRQWGSAATGFKYDCQILPRSSRVPLEILVELPLQPEDEKAIKLMMAQLCDALRNGEIRFGASVTRGMGRVELVDTWVMEEKWSSRSGIVAMLKATNGPANNQGIDLKEWVKSFPEPMQAAREDVTLVLHWRAVAPVMSKAGQDGMAVDMLPLVSSVGNGDVAMVIPGSSIKGVLRAHAERIVRTILDWPEVVGAGRDRYSKQLDLPLVRELFGSARDRDGNMGHRGAVAVEPVYSQSIPAEVWRQVVDALEPPSLMKALTNAKLRGAGIKPQIDLVFHVAVDRWTGGGADSMLYSTLEPCGMTWDPIRITLNPRGLEASYRDAAIFLLLLLLRDLAAGRLPIGFGANRGYGELAIDKAELSLGNGVSCVLAGETLGSLSTSLPKDRLETLSQSWQVWIRNCQREMQQQGAAHG
ncbi:MAG: hypothetical protein HQL80_03235 [Magnetococcales bacterium]|nr:hypothetical protein [Magnetococcales bacterium]